jgi:membrane-associated phospholipid phosphatase
MGFKSGLKKIWSKISLMSAEVVVVMCAFFAALSVFVFVARMIFLEKKEDFDMQVLEFVKLHASDSTTGIMKIFSFLGSHNFLIPANIIFSAYYLFIRKKTWNSIKIPVISLSSVLLMFVLKQVFHRQRPLVPLLQQAKGMSFPSGHALMSFAFYGLIIYLVRQAVKDRSRRVVYTILLLLLILFIGLSRIYLRVHYASDVIAGFSLGLVWLVLSLSIINKMEKISKKQLPVQ